MRGLRSGEHLDATMENMRDQNAAIGRLQLERAGVEDLDERLAGVRDWGPCVFVQACDRVCYLAVLSLEFLGQNFRLTSADDKIDAATTFKRFGGPNRQ